MKLVNTFPELPDYSARRGHKITILDLLSHTSGVRDYVSLFLLSGINIDNMTTDSDAFGVNRAAESTEFFPRQRLAIQ